MVVAKAIVLKRTLILLQQNKLLQQHICRPYLVFCKAIAIRRHTRENLSRLTTLMTIIYHSQHVECLVLNSFNLRLFINK